MPVAKNRKNGQYAFNSHKDKITADDDLAVTRFVSGSNWDRQWWIMADPQQQDWVSKRKRSVPNAGFVALARSFVVFGNAGSGTRCWAHPQRARERTT